MLLVSSRRDARTGDGGGEFCWPTRTAGAGTATRSPRARPSSAAACAAASPALPAPGGHQHTPQRRADRRGHRLAPDPGPLRRSLALAPSPVVAWQAVALAEVSGPEAALALVDGLDLDGYRLFHAIRADLLRRLGRDAEAVAAYEAAIARSGNATERAFLERRRRELARSTPNGDWSLHRYGLRRGGSWQDRPKALEDTMRAPVPARLCCSPWSAWPPRPAAGRATTPPAWPRPPPRPARPPPRPPRPAPTRPRSRRRWPSSTSSTRPRPARRGRWRPPEGPGQPDQAQDERQERVGRPGHRAGRGRQRLPGDHLSRISGDSLLSDLPTIVADLERIDTAWKALDQQIADLPDRRLIRRSRPSSAHGRLHAFLVQS